MLQTCHAKFHHRFYPAYPPFFNITCIFYPLTEQLMVEQRELAAEIDRWLAIFNKVKTVQLLAFNRLVREQELEVIRLKEPKK